MSRVLFRVFCDRPKDAHVLASVTVGKDGLDARVRELIESPKGVRSQRTTYTKADVRDAAVLTTGVLCPCGSLYELDIAALCRGQVTEPRRLRPEDLGVLLQRERPTAL